MKEERFSLGENSNHMVTVKPFNANLRVHIRQVYVNENGEMRASRTGVTLSVEEFNELVKLIPKIQDSIAQYKLHDISPSPPPPPLAVYHHHSSTLLWKRFCLILIEKKNLKDIFKILMLMNICMVQQ